MVALIAGKDFDYIRNVCEVAEKFNNNCEWLHKKRSDQSILVFVSELF